MLNSMHSSVARTFSRRSALPVGVLAVALLASVTLAASYISTTLKELTQRAAAVAEAEVLQKSYPDPEAGSFPRTNVELKLLRALKGDVPENFSVDAPGGIHGDTVSFVPGAPDFKVGAHVILFLKQDAGQKGQYLVQDLGLGKFDVVERNGKKYVERPLDAGTAGLASPQSEQDADANLLTKSIPYELFCELVSGYVSGKGRSDLSSISALLGQATPVTTRPSLFAEARQQQEAREQRRTWLIFAFGVALTALTAGLLLYFLRRRQGGGSGHTGGTLIVVTGLLAAGALSGSALRAYVTYPDNTKWDLDTPLSGKVASQRVIWKQGSASKTNANVFSDVTNSFAKWGSIPGCRLAFTAGGSGASVQNSSDNQNVVYWTTSPSRDFDSSTLAITYSNYTSGSSSHFTDCDIVFNDRDFNWGSPSSGNPASVSLHEIGHFVGFDHTTDKTSIMYPYDQGLTQLSPDDQAGAVFLYPGTNTGTGTGTATGTGTGSNTGTGTGTGTATGTGTGTGTGTNVAVAVVSASPAGGAPGVTVSFSAANSAASTGATIVSYTWNFGDGANGSGQTVTHTYASVGTYTATLTVTDSNGKSDSATTTIAVGNQASVVRAIVLLNRRGGSRDAMQVTLYSSALTNPTQPTGTTNATLTVGGSAFPFTYDPVHGHSLPNSTTRVNVSPRSGLATIQLRNVSLSGIFGNISQPIPISIDFGNGVFIYANLRMQAARGGRFGLTK